MRNALLLGLLSLWGTRSWADSGPDATAQAAYAEAVALVRAELWADALVAADKAVQAAPDWPDPYPLRIKVRAQLLAAPAITTAADTFDARFDYAQAREVAAKLQADCEKYKALAAQATPPPACDDGRAVDARLAAAQQRGEAARQREQQAKEQAARAEVAAKAEAAERADRAAKQAKLDEERRGVMTKYEATLSGVRVRRAFGIITGVVGLGVGGLGLYFYLQGEAAITAVRTGTLPSATGIDEQLTNAGTDRTLALGLAVGAGALLLTGIIIVATCADPPPPVQVGLTPVAGGALLALGGRFP